jgi:(3S)-malyl-CoA thioesterase
MSRTVASLRSLSSSSLSSSSSSSSSSVADRPSPDERDESSRPLIRSVLYVPASNYRALAKLDSLSGRARPDAVMFDLEDGVSPDRKGEARDALFMHLRGSRDREEGGGEGRTSSSASSVDDRPVHHRRLDLLRINRADTPWFEDDTSMAHELASAGFIDAVVLPKVEGGADVEFASRRFLGLSSASDGRPPPPPSDATMTTTTRSPVPLWAMVETPRAVLAAPEIAGMAGVAGLILGTNDLGKDLRLRRRRSSRDGPPATDPAAIAAAAADDDDAHRGGLYASLQWTILAARAHGKVVIDGVYNDIRDEAGFRSECARGRDWGMDGKTLIHPDQVPWTNEIYAPDDEEVEYARRVVRCWDDAVAKAAVARTGSDGRAFTGVAVLDGAMIEELHVDVARRLLRQADIMKSME